MTSNCQSKQLKILALQNSTPVERNCKLGNMHRKNISAQRGRCVCSVRYKEGPEPEAYTKQVQSVFVAVCPRSCFILLNLLLMSKCSGKYILFLELHADFKVEEQQFYYQQSSCQLIIMIQRLSTICLDEQSPSFSSFLQTGSCTDRQSN